MTMHIASTPICTPTQSRVIWPGLQRLLGLRRSRDTLAHLSDAQLADIGVTRQEALAEARRPAWDVPRHWLD